MKRGEKEQRRCERLVSAGEISSSYGLVLLAQVWNNGSFPQCMHSEVGSQIITSTWLDIMNEQGRGCDIGGGGVGGAMGGGRKDKAQRGKLKWMLNFMPHSYGDRQAAEVKPGITLVVE